jgi:hypothetical protein
MCFCIEHSCFEVDRVGWSRENVKILQCFCEEKTFHAVALSLLRRIVESGVGKAFSRLRSRRSTMAACHQRSRWRQRREAHSYRETCLRTSVSSLFLERLVQGPERCCMALLVSELLFRNCADCQSWPVHHPRPLRNAMRRRTGQRLQGPIDSRAASCSLRCGAVIHESGWPVSRERGRLRL